MNGKMTADELAWKIRRDTIEMTHISNGSHIASVLSVADILAVLYADVLNYDINNIKMGDRDILILSKGHAGAAIYAALAEEGFFDADELKTHCANGSRLSRTCFTPCSRDRVFNRLFGAWSTCSCRDGNCI